MEGDQRDADATASGDGYRVLLSVSDAETRCRVAAWLREDGHDVVFARGDDGGAPAADGESSGAGSNAATPRSGFDLAVVDLGGAPRIDDGRAGTGSASVPRLLVRPARPDADGAGPDAWGTDAPGIVADGEVPVDAGPRVLCRRAERLAEGDARTVGLAERRDQYRRLLEFAPEGIVLARDGEVVLANETARTLVAGGSGDPVPTGTVEGRSVTDLFAPGDCGAVEELLDAVERGFPPGEYVSALLVRDDGDPVGVELTGVAVPAGDETMVQLVVRAPDGKPTSRGSRVYGRALEETSVGVSIADVTRPGDPLIYVNESFERITGHDAPQVLGRNCRILQGPDTDPERVAELGDAIAAGESASMTLRNYRADGTPFWNELELTPVPDAGGTVTHYLGFQRDVTDRVDSKHRLTALHETTRDLMAAETKREVCDIAVETADEVLDLPAAGVYLHDPEAGCLRPVAVSETTHGVVRDLPTFSPGEGLAWEAFDSGDPLVVDDVRDHEEVYNPETPIRSEMILPLGEHGLLISGSPDAGAFDEGDARFGRTLAMNVETALDRADREGTLRERTRELESRIRQQELVADLGRRAIGGEDIETLFEAAASGVAGALETDCCGVLEYRPAREDLLLRAGVGWDEDSVGEATVGAGYGSQAGYTLLRGGSVVVEDAATEDRFERSALLADCEATSGISVVIGSPDDPWGVLATHATDARAFTDDDANFVRSVAALLATAIERRERQRELERFETVVRTAGEPIYTLDEGCHFVDVNDAMAELTGYDEADLLDEHVSKVFDGDDADRLQAVVQGLVDGEETDETLELTVTRADGERRLCLASVAVLPSQGEFRGTVGILRDITERRRREQRMEVMDRILRHNLRNEMNVVRGRAEILRRIADGTADGEADEQIDEIVRAADSLLSLSEDARRFHEAFDDRDRTPRVVDLAGIVRGVVEDARDRFPDATVETDLSDRIPVEVHPAIRMAVAELVENAIVHNDRPDPTVSLSATVGDDAVELVVADDGPGLPPLERRTFQRKVESPLEHASGLGLWLVNWIVSSSGGEVTCDVDHPRGSVVRVRLPRAEDGEA